MQISGVVAPEVADPGSPSRAPGSRLSDLAGRAILIVLGILLVEVLIEGWLVTRLGTPIGFDELSGDVVVEPAGWPKTLKSALYFVLLALTIVKLTVDKAWRRLTTPADYALVVTAVVLAVAGVAGGSSAQLIGQALFVYFRGVIVFYAVRALRPTVASFKPLFWIGGTIIAVNVVIGFVQFIVGKPAYTALGWVDMKWVFENRAQGLLDHPNDLGHLTGFMLLGLLAWFLTRGKVTRRWWALFVLIAVGLAVAQSRQSLLAVVAAMVVIAAVKRAQLKRIAAAGLVVVALSALPMVLSPANRAQLAYRLGGVFKAFQVQRPDCQRTKTCEDREVRVLFIQQGLKLWAASPVLGYGVGQFGGIVAVKADPQWMQDPRFKEVLGPQGFDMHLFKATSVDVFWLHLLVEAGLLGVIAYFVWLWLVSAPMLRAANKRGPPKEGEPVITWSVATIVFAVLIAAWSPSLEDPLFPPLMFAVLGLGWVLTQRERERA